MMVYDNINIIFYKPFTFIFMLIESTFIMVELLSPGGNLEKIRIAIDYGADAVYSGYKKFGLRSRAGNLDKNQIKEAIAFVHKSGRKFYLTLNSYLFDKEFDELIDFLKFLNNYPPDALIVSDLGVLNVVNELTNIPIHMSTQANITNSYAARILKRYNVKRIVAAREMDINDIRSFVKNSSIDLEVFVHGAMCMAYSGRCFLSSYLTGRSANQGDCAQSCRWKYTVVEETRKDAPITIEEHKEGSFIFNSYDMCAVEILDEIIDAGVSSIKIEGRMKSVYYTAVTTAVYRDAVDTILSGGDYKAKIPFYMDELKKISHRPYSLGFYKDKPMQYIKSSGYERNCDFIAIVEKKSKDRIYLKLRGQLKKGKYEFFTHNLRVVYIDIEKIYNIDDTEKSIGNPNEFVYICADINVERFDILRRCN